MKAFQFLKARLRSSGRRSYLVTDADGNTRVRKLRAQEVEELKKDGWEVDEAEVAPNRNDLRAQGIGKQHHRRHVPPHRRTGKGTGKGSVFTHMEQQYVDKKGQKRRVRFPRPEGM